MSENLFKINGREAILNNRNTILKTLSKLELGDKRNESSLENMCIRVTQIKNPKDLKDKYSHPNKSTKKFKIKSTLEKIKPNSYLNIRKDGSDRKNMKLILHNKELKIEEDLFIKTDTLLNSGNFVRKYKFFTDNLLKNMEEKAKIRLKEKQINSIKTKDFKLQIEEYIEKMKKEKINKEKKIDYVYKYVPKPVISPSSSRFQEIKANNNFIKSINSIQRNIIFKNDKNDDIKTDKIMSFNKKEDGSILSNTLLRTHYNLPTICKTETSLPDDPPEDIENVLTDDNILLTETLNRKFLTTDSSKQSSDNLFISRLPINFSIMGRNKNPLNTKE